jgi:isoleucyl-tRNA synthetase
MSPFFKPVSSKVDFAALEEQVLQFWREQQVFRRTWQERQDAPLFMLYEGPPTANGSPGIHHVLARVYKDCIPRFKTMKGYRAFRKGGWDTHGLPVELEVEKELGIRSKQEILFPDTFRDRNADQDERPPRGERRHCTDRLG